MDCLQEGVDAVCGSAESDERDDGDPIRAVSLASMTMKTRLTGSSTVARTLALSAIDSSGAPGMRMTTAASSATPMFAALKTAALRGELLKLRETPAHSPAA
jgi:hypothetical protein